MAMNDDEKWMQIAIQESLNAQNIGEVPVGAVIVKDGLLLAKGHNRSISKNDATAHAEIEAIRFAGKALKNYRLTGSSLYVTLEPCAMCFGAIIHARIGRLIFGAYDSKTGVCESCGSLNELDFFNHKVIIESGVLKDECHKILHNFFKSKR